MDSLRDVVRQLQQYAEEGSLAALEAVLWNGTERALRLAAANYLGRAGEPGQVLLRAAFTDPRLDALGQRAVFKNLRIEPNVRDEAVLNFLLRSSSRRARHQGRRLVREAIATGSSAHPRYLLPEPYCYMADLADNFASFLRTTQGKVWHLVVRALGTAGEGDTEAAVHALIGEMPRRDGSEVDALAWALINIGRAAVPALIRALPYSIEPQRSGLVHALELIGDARAIVPLEMLAGQNPPQKAIRDALPRIRQALETLRQKNSHR